MLRDHRKTRKLSWAVSLSRLLSRISLLRMWTGVRGLCGGFMGGYLAGGVNVIVVQFAAGK